jgi:3-isopropylmalate/(R)-2-methylmalate dehydratase small subunit
LTLGNGVKFLEKFKKIISIVTPFDKANVDTDQIIPKQFLKLIQKIGFGDYLFYNWRFENDGEPKKDFILNNPKYANSEILVTNENFGCGSSREHAVWALKDYGFSVIIAPSFADIFYSNCFKNGVLAIQMPKSFVKLLLTYENNLEIDLENQEIIINDVKEHFEIQSDKRHRLLNGLDDIELTLKSEDKIKLFEKNSSVPSIFN